MKWNSRIRCALVCLFFTALFSLFSFRLVYLQMIKHDEYAGLAAEKHVYKQPIFAERGSILDANNEVLAHNTPVETVVADATHINNRDAIIPVLRTALDLPADELTEKLSGDRRYIILKREVPVATANALREKLRGQNLRGIYFERDMTRIYPNGSMLCHVIGFTDFEHRGIQGVESSMEEYLHGQDGYRFIEHNRAGQEIVLYRGQERAPRDGYQVHLTVDLNLQNIVENEIDAAVREYSPQKATIILMRPQTGEILAMANRPHYDLNERSEAKPEQMKNRAIIDMMEPGSTFKIVSAAAALNEKKVRPDTTIFCENGIWNYGGKPLHDHKAYGELSVQDILVKSSNIGAAKLAMSIGEQKFYEYIRRFGFGDRTGVELPGEIPGVIRPPQSWSKISITRIPMGHEVGVTPLQMTVAMATIANGGKLVTPRIVKSITTEDGKTITTFSPTVLRQVISPETAAQVGNALRGVVSDRGTAAAAAVPGFTISGKTGTAQKVDPHGGYEHGKYVVSFSGYLPSDHPEFVGIVVLDDAKTANPELNYGGLVAGPIFARIAEKAARYLDLQPHEDIGKTSSAGRVAATNAPHR
ncbi:MAG TPA: penicillin-binding protein 2 [Chthoniobacterales bacterium]|jgi:cell division protein FtsI (penicillin-binding protein 3)/stage V sporulation protein D (sporulation-specific penicillin-binding protein)|nr:penicillin-binding protein 2 [Chthoniobacterales bacterium]